MLRHRDQCVGDDGASGRHHGHANPRKGGVATVEELQDRRRLPLFLRRNRLCISGVPTSFTSHLSRLNFRPRASSTVFHITWKSLP